VGEDQQPEKRIPIEPPIELGSVPYTELVLREPTAGEMVRVDKLTGYAWTVALVAAVAGVPPPVIERLGVRTLNEASIYLTGFTTAALTTPTPA
jgi:hypothetical protein